MNFQKNQYLAGREQEVSLPSNNDIKFIIKRIPIRQILLELQSSCVMNTKDIINLDNLQQNNKPQSESDIAKGINMSNLAICKGVVFPKITLTEAEAIDENSLCINQLLDDDYNFLFNKITGTGKEEQKSLQNFCQDGNAASIG